MKAGHLELLLAISVVVSPGCRRPTPPEESDAAKLPNWTVQDAAATPADTLFIDGAILTMDGSALTYVEAVATRGGRVVWTGPAWQLLEEDRKGRIAEGLLADFVILSADPNWTQPSEIRDIEVLETIKEDETVFFAETDTHKTR